LAITCPKCQSDNPDTSQFCGTCATRLNPAGPPPASLTKTLETPVQILTKGTLIAGKYRIVEEIGRGGMGIVYKAEDIKLQRPVALKFLPHQWVSDPDARERFTQEARAASALDHPNVCTIHEIEETDDGRLYIAMGCYEGESLREKIKRGPLETNEAIDLAIQTASGMAKAHAKGIVHRDLKPANILVTQDGVAKVVDFGLAKLAGQVKLTREGTTVGTVAYMSPEQAKGEAVDQRTDIWSLGVVLYEMLSGVLPFKGDHEQTLIHSILQQEPERLTKFRKDLPQGLENLVFKALSKKPAARYQTMDEILGDLKAIADGLRPASGASLFLRGRVLGMKKIHAYPALAGLMVVAVLAALFVFPKRGQTINSIAVLPLANLSGDPDQEYFADGMTEELITNLAKIGALKVISRTSMMQYKGTKKPLPLIAKELNVDALIEGSVLREGGQVRITAQLIQASTDHPLWAESYQRDLHSVVALQGEIATVIADRVRAAVTPTERARLASARSVNPVAYEAYLKGMQSFSRFTPQDLDTALEYFELALEKDPNYAAAYQGIAFVWLLRQQAGYTPPREAGPKAKAAALKAIGLDSTLGEGHAALAAVYYLYEWNWAGAEVEFKRAIELNPNFPDVRSMYSHYLMIMNRQEEAMAQMQRALELDPLNAAIQVHHAFLLESAGRYDEAIVQWRNMLRTSPQNAMAHGRLSNDLFRKAKYEESLAEMKAYYAGDQEMEGALTQEYAQSGYRSAMRRAADLLAARGRTGYTLPTDVAMLYALAGEKVQALDWLEKAFEARDPNMPYLNLYPEFEILHSDPRFQDLLRRMSLPINEQK
jgi:serine/threonine protein kinase/tetratricopeptide (TPR) repeat protein